MSKYVSEKKSDAFINGYAWAIEQLLVYKKSLEEVKAYLASDDFDKGAIAAMYDSIADGSVKDPYEDAC